MLDIIKGVHIIVQDLDAVKLAFPHGELEMFESFLWDTLTLLAGYASMLMQDCIIVMSNQFNSPGLT